MKIHIVQKGDTLWNIAKKYGVNFEELKSMNTQLSNPDLIMPGMKIKVPSGNVAIKKEAPVQAPKKEMPIAEHPFAKEKPKAVISEENNVPKAPAAEKQSKPYIPPVPNVQHPVYTGVDLNNYYTVNMAMMSNPPLPPKPENILPEVKKVDELKKGATKDPSYSLPLNQHKEGSENMANNMPNLSNVPNMSNVSNMQNNPNMQNMPNTPNIPNMPNVAGVQSQPNMPMPAYTAPAMYAPQYCPPPYMVPVSPVLPGSGLCPPAPCHPMPFGYGPMMPSQPFPVNPWAGVPVSPMLPGSGLHSPNHVLGAFEGGHDDDDFEYGAQAPNMPNQQAVAPGYFPPQDDCGCGGPTPYYPYQQDYRFNYGYPVQQPYPAYQGYSPYGYYPGPVAPDGQMFGMPDYEDRDDDED